MRPAAVGWRGRAAPRRTERPPVRCVRRGRQVEGQAGVGVGEVDAEELTDLGDPPGDGVAVDAEDGGGLDQGGLGVEIDGEGPDQVARLGVQGGEKRLGGGDERVGSGPGEQELGQAEAVDVQETAGLDPRPGQAGGVASLGQGAGDAAGAGVRPGHAHVEVEVGQAALGLPYASGQPVHRSGTGLGAVGHPGHPAVVLRHDDRRDSLGGQRGDHVGAQRHHVHRAAHADADARVPAVQPPARLRRAAAQRGAGIVARLKEFAEQAGSTPGIAFHVHPAQRQRSLDRGRRHREDLLVAGHRGRAGYVVLRGADRRAVLRGVSLRVALRAVSSRVALRLASPRIVLRSASRHVARRAACDEPRLRGPAVRGEDRYRDAAARQPLAHRDVCPERSRYSGTEQYWPRSSPVR